MNKEFPKLRAQALRLLQEEANLNEIVQLVGVDALSLEDRVKLDACKSIREDYLHQNAFHDIDTYSSMNKQYKMLKLILSYFDLAVDGVGKGAPFNKLETLPVKEKIGRFKYLEEDKVDGAYDSLMQELKDSIQALIAEEAENDD